MNTEVHFEILLLSAADPKWRCIIPVDDDGGEDDAGILEWCCLTGREGRCDAVSVCGISDRVAAADDAIDRRIQFGNPKILEKKMSSLSPEKTPISDSKKKRSSSWSEQFHPGDRVDANEALRHVILKMRLHSISNSESSTPHSESEPDSADSFTPTPPCDGGADYFSLLSDELLLNVLTRASPDGKQHISNSLVCRRWCILIGKLTQSIALLDWEFLESGRLSFRFPNLVYISIVPACFKFQRNSGILLHTRSMKFHLNSGDLESSVFFVHEDDILDSDTIDRGLLILSEGCRNLRQIALMNATEKGLEFLSRNCEMLQEMELHCCSDLSLRGIHGCHNLQIVKLIGRLKGVYDLAISDIGMTILAQGCRRLLKLELVGCEGSFDGIKAMGICCQMLEELTLSDHRMEGGWLSALSYCVNLKILNIHSCEYVDPNPGLHEHLGACPMLEELHLRRCRLQSQESVMSLFLVCRKVRGLVIEDCWGLNDNIFAAATILRGIRSVSLEGCSLLTTEGLESVVLSWRELSRLKVVSCSNIRDSEIGSELAALFSGLKELKWRPSSKSLLADGLSGTGVGQGGRSLRGK
ncbi:hypothetical protein M569_13501 [Genlisea aurea]|uniref:F-box domain-containing protein n=1 Tax=Genlisea aurea TaxID=192259 RepID=S8CAA4_9LAMI|nr:hypothetical protein M569_13501 [Genlisea aurea]